MTVNLPAIPPEALRLAAGAALLLAGWLWLRKELTPARFLSIFETDGVLSARQLLAWVVALYGLCMRAAGRMDDLGLEKCLEWSTVLFGIGGAVKAVGAFRQPTTVNAQQVKADVQADTVNLNGGSPPQPAL